MRVVRYENSQERSILISMIVDKNTLGIISAKWQGDMFEGKWANVIGTWCVEYFRKYQKAPASKIANMFISWKERTKDTKTIELVEDFLSSLSDEYEKTDPNYQHTVDMAGKYFNRVKISKFVESLQGSLDENRLEEAQEKITNFTRIEVGGGRRIQLFTSVDEIRSAFSRDNEEVLVTYPGALGQFFGNSLERDGFIAFQGPEKSTKSMWMLDIAYRAVCQRKRVAFFEVGDLSERQCKHRFLTRVSQIPMRSPGNKWPLKVRYPVSIVPPKDPKGFYASVTFEEKIYKKALDEQTAIQACEDFMREKVKSEKPYFYLSIHPNSSINVDGIRSIINTWQVEDNWTPDIVIVDYADILAPPIGVKDTRDQINTNWKNLRRLSQELHCLVITATQADADSYSRITMDRSNFSEDHRKMAHVTGLVGINVTASEKENGQCRLSWIVLREGEFSSKRVCHVAGCLPLCMTSVKSTF